MNKLNWLLLRVEAHILKEQPDEALEYLLRAAEIEDDPELWNRAADLAYQIEEYKISVRCLKRILDLESDYINAHRNLAAIYFNNLIDLSNAAVEFRFLLDAEPDNHRAMLSLANILALINEPEESLTLFNQLCESEKPSKPALLGRAELYQSLGEPLEALDSLVQFKDLFWDDSDFLFEFMSLAFAAGREEAGNDALIALETLRASGALEPSKFQKISSSEVIEVYKCLLADVEKRRNYTHIEMLRGIMPWVWAEYADNIPTIIGWSRRTQEMSWVSDEPKLRARVTLYSTNAFHSRATNFGRKLLKRIKCPAPSTCVVADISSLLTLFELGLLEKTVDYFGEIFIPEAYLTTVLEDRKKMLLNQQSRKKNVEILKTMLDADSISVCDGSLENMSYVAEYNQDEEHHYHMIDLIQPIHSAGYFSDDDLRRFAAVQQKESNVDSEHSALKHLQKIRVELATLEVLVQINLLEKISKFFNLHILKSEKNEIRDRLVGIEKLEKTRERHIALWNFLRDDDRFTFVSHTVPEEMKTEEKEDRRYTSFLGEFVAKENNLPLLVDDRAIQAFTFNERADAEYAAFGTDTLILALSETDELSEDAATNAFLHLMKWRYRFILPSADILKNLASRHKTHPPGIPLREIAVYVHDCMRDPGLSAVPEDTDLHESMAMRLYQSWLSVISEFLVSIWVDSSFSMETAQHLTKWSVEELIPSTPCVLNGTARWRLGISINRSLMSHTLIISSTSTKAERICEMMSCLKKELRIPDEEYNHLITEILDDRNRRNT